MTTTATALATLSEYETKPVPMSTDAALLLREVGGKRLEVVRSDADGWWDVTATSAVGTVVVPGLQLLVRPKVSNANLFHLLGASRSRIDLRHDAFDYDGQSLLPAFAAFYAHQLDAALSRGVARRYVEEEDRLLAIRGRIDLPAQLRGGGLPIPVACRFDDFTADIPLNRIVRAAAIKLLRLPGVVATTQRELVGLLDRLDGMTDLRIADLARPIAFTRLDQHYAVAEGLARMVLVDASIHDAGGLRGASTFLIDMNQVFESYVQHQLRAALRGRLRVVGQQRSKLGTGHSVTIKPDLVFQRGRTVVHVGDAKYKLTESGGGKEADYYQLLAYATALGVPAGVLVYACDSEAAQRTELFVHHAGTVLRTWPMTLSGPAADIDAQLATLADHISRWVSE